MSTSNDTSTLQEQAMQQHQGETNTIAENNRNKSQNSRPGSSSGTSEMDTKLAKVPSDYMVQISSYWEEEFERQQEVEEGEADDETKKILQQQTSSQDDTGAKQEQQADQKPLSSVTQPQDPHAGDKESTLDAPESGDERVQENGAKIDLKMSDVDEDEDDLLEVILESQYASREIEPDATPKATVKAKGDKIDMQEDEDDDDILKDILKKQEAAYNQEYSAIEGTPGAFRLPAAPGSAPTGTKAEATISKHVADNNSSLEEKRIVQPEFAAIRRDAQEQHTHQQEQEGDVSESQVLEAEPVFQAKDMEHSNRKKRILVMVVVALVVTLAITLSVLLTRPTTEIKADVDDRDPRCSTVPIMEQDPALQCLCFNTTQAIWDNFTETEQEDFYIGKEILTNVTLIDKEINLMLEPTSCTPQANSLLSLISLGGRGTPGKARFVDVFRRFRSSIITYYSSMVIYNSMNGVHWINADGWNEPTTPSSRFFGRQLFFLGTATALELPANNLKGTIPSEIRFLRDLRRLDFSGNPGIVGTLPSALAALTKLNSLQLTGTSMEGSIPSFMQSLERLDVLQLSDMQLTGTIPPELFTARLRLIDLSKNKFAGKIPSEISNSSRLQTLRLNNNQLSGPLPSTIGDLSELEFLNLSFNRFTGSIPATMGNIPFLEFSSFVDSGLSGMIPETFCQSVPTDDADGSAALASNDNRQQQTQQVVLGDCAKSGATGDESTAISPDCSCCSNLDGGVNGQTEVVVTCME